MFTRIMKAFGVTLAIILLAGCKDEPVAPGGGYGMLLVQPRISAGAPPPLDAVEVTLDGPTDTTVALGQSGGFFEGTIGGLEPGSYSLLILGRASGNVSYFGQTSGIQVTAGENADATVPFNAFVSELVSPPPYTSAFRFPLLFSSTPDADEYVLESADNPNFTDSESITLSDTIGVVTVTNLGDYYFRVRAGNNTVSSANAAPSDVINITVRADGRGNNSEGNAFLLGSGFTINGILTGNNIHPADQLDWFRVLVPTAGLQLIVRARAQSLIPQSPIDPVVEIRSGADPGTILVQNDNLNGNTRDAGLTFTIPAAGDYLIVVRAASGSPVGHYNLETYLTSSNAVSTVTVDPATAALQTGQSLTLRTTLRDVNGVELFFRNVTWSSSDNGIAGVDANGVVTANANGMATITATSEGVNGTATVTVTDAVPAVASIAFTPSGASTEVGAAAIMHAEARTADGQLIPSADVTFTTLNGAVASAIPGAMAGNAIVFGNGIGQTAVVAQGDGVTGFGLVTVTWPGLEPLTRWSPMQSGTGDNLHGVWAADENDIHAVGSAGVQRRYNGTSWVDETLGAAGTLHSVFGLGPNNAWAAGLSLADADNGVLQFNGTNWSFFGLAPARATRGIWAANPNAIFMAVDDGPSIERYDGDTWETDDTGGAAGNRAVWGTSADNVWAVGFTGEIVQFDGAAWSVIPTGQSDNFHGVWGSRPSNIIVVGTGPQASHYDGAMWSPVPLPIAGTLNAVWGRAPNDIYAVGEAGRIMHYDGVDWTLQQSGVGIDLYGITGTPSGDIYVAGQGGTILKGRVPEPLMLTDIASGYQMGCAVSEHHQAYCWGSNSFGQLGIGDPLIEDSIPRAVSGNFTFTQIVTAGGGETDQGYHACGLTDNGLAYCWGRDFYGQLGDGTSGDQSSTPTLVSGGHTFTKLTAGFNHTCGLDANQVAWCWGDNERGQLGNNASGTGVMAATPERVVGSIAWLDISAGNEHTCGIAETDGAAYCWGYNAYGQLGDNTETQRIVPTAVFGGGEYVAISAGDRHTCAIDTDNVAWCWGWNTNGQLGVVSPPDMCLGTLACELAPVQVNTSETFASISAGNRFTCGVNPSGDGYCWGQNTSGSLGTGNANDQNFPTPVSGRHTFQFIRAGRDNACGVTTSGRGYCWGSNGLGALGNNSTIDSNVPVLIYDP